MLVPTYSLELQGDELVLSDDLLAAVKQCTLLGQVLLRLPDGFVGPPSAALKEALLVPCGHRLRVGPFPLSEESLAAAAEWLHQGTQLAVLELTSNQTSPADHAALVSLLEKVWGAEQPRARLVVRVHVPQCDPDQAAAEASALTQEALTASIQALRGWAGEVQAVAGPATRPSLEALAQAAKQARGRDSELDHQRLSWEAEGFHWTVEEVGALHRLAVEAVGEASVMLTEAELPPTPEAAAALPPPAASSNGVAGPTDVVDAFLACLRTDREDSLYTTVVVDRSGICLGLVYSNALSIKASVACGRGVYWSRSRNGLWRKGDTSGAWQALLQVDLDCDSDALRFMVVQNGEPPAFCHRNCRTCWGECGGLSELERTLTARRKSAPEGSYTKRLFDDPDLLRNKLLEEAQELIEATEPDHVAAEAADLLYFALVRCAAVGVGVADIEGHLNRRALKLKRRPGNAKAYRIKAADEALQQISDAAASSS